MPLTDYSEIQNLIDNGYKFRFGDYFSIAAKYFEEHVLKIMGFFLVYFAATYAINSVKPVGTWITTLFGPILLSGIYIYFKKNDRKEPADFNTFFEGFEFSKDIILRVVASMAILLIAALPFIYYVYDSGLVEWIMEVSQNPNDSEMIAETFPGFPPMYSLFLLIPFIFLAISYSWADMFIVLKGMNFWDALEASRQVIGENWFTIFAFYVVAAIGLGIATMVTCGLGVFIGIPFIFILNYVAFADVVGLNRSEPDNDILDHLVG